MRTSLHFFSFHVTPFDFLHLFPLLMKRGIIEAGWEKKGMRIKKERKPMFYCISILSSLYMIVFLSPHYFSVK